MSQIKPRLLCFFLLPWTMALSCSGEGFTPAAPRIWRLSSPDGGIAVDIIHENLGGVLDFPDESALYYSVSHEGREALSFSPLGIDTSPHVFHTGLKYLQESRRTIDTSYEMQVGKRRHRTIIGNELKLTFENANGAQMEIIFRVHQDGMAFRYHLLGEGDVTVGGEFTGFAPPGYARAFLAPYDVAGAAFSGTYEQMPKEVKVGESAASSGWAYPALFDVDDGATWIMISEADMDGTYCGTRLHEEPLDNLYRIRFPRAGEGNGVGDVYPRTTLPLLTPWRVMLVGSLADVVGSTLVDDLARPSIIGEAAWVRPGKAAWSWFSQWTGGFDLQAEYVAFAAEMGWDHVLIDEGWDRWENVEEAMPDFIAAAAMENIGIHLWYNSGGAHNFNEGTPREKMLDPEIRQAEMDKLANWGAAGIKVDFFESDKQDRMQQYVGLLTDAAERGLMVNLHGATLPRGWQRTYPNLMTYEAVRGSEYYLVSPKGPGPADNVLYAFTRNVVGSMDYTPLTFAAALDESGASYAHTLALSVVFESGIQHFADRADADAQSGYRALFTAAPFVQTFLRDLPTIWDDTRLLDGDPGSHIVLARQHQNLWYVGALNALEAPRSISLDIAFLGDGNWQWTAIAQGESTTQFVETQSTIDPTAPLLLELPPIGGVVGVFRTAM